MIYAQESLVDEIIVDNFAGGGGASTGIEIATGMAVAIAINHDPAATAMKVNGRSMPNNPKQAYMPDKLHGAQGTMGNVAMVPKDECGVVFGG